MNIKTETVPCSLSSDWDDFVLSREDSNFVDLWRWQNLIQNTYPLPTFCIWAVDEKGEKCGFLSLTHSHHPLLGPYLSTAPFDNWGGFSANSGETETALLIAAHDLRLKLNADFAVVRLPHDLQSPPSGWKKDTSRAWYSLDLCGGHEQIFNNLSSNLKSKVRRSLKQGFQTRWGKEELLKEFHQTLNLCMRELGSPVHPLKYYYSMLGLMPDNVDILLVDAPGAPAIGCALLISYKKSIILYHSTILRAFRSQYAGNFMYWEIIKRYAGLNFSRLDMGRSPGGSGNEIFKMEWKPARYDLVEWYDLPTGKPLPAINQNNPKFEMAQKIWKRLPLPLVKFFGPRLMWGLI